MSIDLDPLREWVSYALERASTCEQDQRDYPVISDSYQRLATKAGMFRSLALEVERIIVDIEKGVEK